MELGRSKIIVLGPHHDSRVFLDHFHPLFALLGRWRVVRAMKEREMGGWELKGIQEDEGWWLGIEERVRRERELLLRE